MGTNVAFIIVNSVNKNYNVLYIKNLKTVIIFPIN